MPDVFISYATTDRGIADFVHKHLSTDGLNVFMAGISLAPSVPWSQEIRAKLDISPWVIFLASEAACCSPYVQQELGMALHGNKHVIPIVWDIEPSRLPGWIKELQAVDLRRATIDQIREKFTEIANVIKQDKANGWLIAGALLGALIYLASRK